MTELQGCGRCIRPNGLPQRIQKRHPDSGRELVLYPSPEQHPGRKRDLRQPACAGIENRAVGVQPEEEIRKSLDHCGQLGSGLPETLLDQNLLGDVPESEQTAAAANRHPPELDIPHLLPIPANHTGDQSVPVATDQFLPYLQDFLSIRRIRMSTLEPRIQHGNVLEGISGDPGKRRVQVPALARIVHQNKPVRRFAEDREADIRPGMRRFAGGFDPGYLPASVMRSSVSRHCNRSSAGRPGFKTPERNP